MAFAGCATGDIVMVATIAGGERVQVPMGKAGVEMTRKDDVQIETATFTLNEAKKIIHKFALVDARGRTLRSVRVDDVSDDPPVTVHEDTQPKTTGGRWQVETAPLEFGDTRIPWLSTISNSIRIYRFTLTFADGATLVVDQGAYYPAAIKAGVRHAMGQNY